MIIYQTAYVVLSRATPMPSAFEPGCNKCRRRVLAQLGVLFRNALSEFPVLGSNFQSPSLALRGSRGNLAFMHAIWIVAVFVTVGCALVNALSWGYLGFWLFGQSVQMMQTGEMPRLDDKAIKAVTILLGSVVLGGLSAMLIVRLGGA
jgi:hypothetical protein